MVIKGNEIIDALYTILHAPTTFSPSCKLQSQKKNLETHWKILLPLLPYTYTYSTFQ